VCERTPPTILSPLALHVALPISQPRAALGPGRHRGRLCLRSRLAGGAGARLEAGRLARAAAAVEPAPRGADLRNCLRTGLAGSRSEEHTSELQSRENLVCRLLHE